LALRRSCSRDERSLERALDLDARVAVVIENLAKRKAYHQSGRVRQLRADGDAPYG